MDISFITCSSARNISKSYSHSKPRERIAQPIADDRKNITPIVENGPHKFNEKLTEISLQSVGTTLINQAKESMFSSTPLRCNRWCHRCIDGEDEDSQCFLFSIIHFLYSIQECRARVVNRVVKNRRGFVGPWPWVHIVVSWPNTWAIYFALLIRLYLQYDL